MTANKSGLAGEKKDELASAARGLPAGMLADCLRAHHRFFSCLGGSQAEVGVFTVHEKGAVKAAKPLPEVSPYQHECPADHRHDSYFAVGRPPGPGGLWVEEPVTCEDGTQAGRKAEG